MEDALVVSQSEWYKPVDESLPWRSFTANDATTYPIEGAQLWVELENGLNGPAHFSQKTPGQFSYFNPPPATVGQDVVRWAYKHWNPNFTQADGAK